MDTNDLMKRIGKIKVTERLLWNPDVMALFGSCIVLDVDRWDYNRVYVYTVACPEFDRLADGESIPMYDGIFTKDEDGRVAFKWEKVT